MMALLRHLKALKGGLLDPRGSLANEVATILCYRASNVGSFSHRRDSPVLVSIYSGNGGNHEYNSLSKSTIHKHT